MTELTSVYAMQQYETYYQTKMNMPEGIMCKQIQWIAVVIIRRPKQCMTADNQEIGCVKIDGLRTQIIYTYFIVYLEPTTHGLGECNMNTREKKTIKYLSL